MEYTAEFETLNANSRVFSTLSNRAVFGRAEGILRSALYL